MTVEELRACCAKLARVQSERDSARQAFAAADAERHELAELVEVLRAACREVLSDVERADKNNVVWPDTVRRLKAALAGAREAPPEPASIGPVVWRTGSRAPINEATRDRWIGDGLNAIARGVGWQNTHSGDSIVMVSLDRAFGSVDVIDAQIRRIGTAEIKQLLAGNLEGS